MDSRKTSTVIVIGLLAIMGVLGLGLDFINLSPPQRTLLVISRILNLLSIAAVMYVLRRRCNQGSCSYELLAYGLSACILLGLSFYIVTATTYFQATGANDRMIILPLFSLVLLAIHPRVAPQLWWIAGCFLLDLAVINWINHIELSACLQEMLSLLVAVVLGLTANLWQHTQDRQRYIVGVQMARYESELRQVREQQAKAALDALRDRDADWAALIDASPAVVVVFDSRGIVLTCNKSAQDFGMNFGDDLLSKSHRHPHADFFEPILRDPDADLAHKPFEHWSGNDDEPQLITFFASRIQSRAGGYRTVIAGYDTTETYHLRQQLHRNFQDKTLGSMMAGITHDFNNLLMVISGSAEMLAFQEQLEGRAQNNIEEILSAAQKASGLTRRLLLFAKNRPRAAKNIELNRVITELKPLLLRLKGNHNHLSFHPAHEELWVKIDLSEVEQVVMNLVTNARDALDQPGLIEVRLEAMDDRVLLLVKDEGHGIPSDLQAKIFSPFFTTKDEQGGSGIGLSTVHEIVRHAQGTIEVESSAGLGTLFRIELPRCEAGRATTPKPAAPGTQSLPVSSALVVESETKLRRISGAIVQQLGIEAHLAANAPHALAQSRQLPRLDLLICDLHLHPGRPELLLAQLRSRHPQLQAIFTTAYSEDLSLLLRLRKQGHTILQKPFTGEELRKIIVLHAGSTGRPPDLEEALPNATRSS